MTSIVFFTFRNYWKRGHIPSYPSSHALHPARKEPIAVSPSEWHAVKSAIRSKEDIEQRYVCTKIYEVLLEMLSGSLGFSNNHHQHHHQNHQNHHHHHHHHQNHHHHHHKNWRNNFTACSCNCAPKPNDCNLAIRTLHLFGLRKPCRVPWQVSNLQTQLLQASNHRGRNTSKVK